MITKSMKWVLALSSCLLSFQTLAQNGTGNNGRQIVQNSKLKSEGSANSLNNLKSLVSKNNKPWESGAFSGKEPQASLKEIYERTSQVLKSPLRSQKMGGMDGGGGNALLCEEDGKYSIELLDLREAKDLGLKLDFGPNDDFGSIISHTLNKLSKISPARAAVYSSMSWNLLSQDTQWISNKSMPIIDDVNLAIVPRGCLFLQVAIQRPLDQKNLPNAKTYIIDKDIFFLLDEPSKAALVLHEILYREARFSGKSNSVFTRHLVGEFLSENLEKYSLENLNSLYVGNDVYCSESVGFPAFFSSIGEETATRCGFLSSINYTLKSSFNVFAYHTKERVFFSGEIEGQTGIIQRNVFYSSNTNKRPDYYASSSQFSGNLNLLVRKGNSVISKFPKINIHNGGLLAGIKLSSSITAEPSNQLSLFDWTSWSKFISNSFINDPEKTPAITNSAFQIVGRSIRFESPYIKFVSSDDCTKTSECLDSIQIVIEKIAGEVRVNMTLGNYTEGYLLVYSPKTKDDTIVYPESKDGWVLAHYIKFSQDGIPTHYGRNVSGPGNSHEIKYFPILK